MGETSTSGDRPLAFLLDQVAEYLVLYDWRLNPEVSNDALVVVEPATGWPVTLGVTDDGRGGTKLHASAQVDRGMARVLGSNLGRMLGMVQVLPSGDGSVVRRWSPYRSEDIERTPHEAVDWAVTTIETMLEELRARGPQAPPAPVPPAVPSQPLAPVIAPPVTAPGPSSSATEVEALEQRIAEYDGLNAAVQAELASVRKELATTQGLLGTAVRERDAANALMRDFTARSPEPATPAAPAIDPIPKLVGTFHLLTEVGTRTSTLIEVLRRYLDIAPGDARLREQLAVCLVRDDQLPDALEIFSDLGAEGLTPRGASAFVEACLRQRTLPSDLEILGRVDWRGTVASLLRDVPSWAPRDQLLDVTEVIGHSGPPQFGSFLQLVATTIPNAQLERLFDIWFEVDTPGSLDQLLDWLDAQRVTVGHSWVRNAVELALGDEDRRIARRALDTLVNDAADRRDTDGLLGLVDGARDRMKASEWRTWAVGWLREAASAGGSTAQMDRCASMTLDVLRDLPAVREEDPEFALAAVLEAKASPEVVKALHAELDRLRPLDITVRDVTTVAEALKAAKERYVGLVVLPEAERSAAKRGATGVAKAREALFALGALADRYAAGELDAGLDDALATLPGFKPDISDSAKNQFSQDYLRTLPDKSKIMLGPHIDIGGGDAGRAYFYIDRGRKRIILGHLGHLRGKKDT